MYLSIGNSCVVSHWLRKTKLQSNETHFFDWIITSFKTVIEILNIVDEEKLCEKLKTNIVFEKALFENHKVVLCNNFDTFKSVHDLPANGDDDAIYMEHFVNKYVRRYTRLIHKIKVEDTLQFILFLNCVYSDINLHVDLFNQILTKLHKNHNFKLKILTTDKSDKKELNKTDFCEIIHLEDYRICPNHKGWTLEHYDWEVVLNTIKNNKCAI